MRTTPKVLVAGLLALGLAACSQAPAQPTSAPYTFQSLVTDLGAAGLHLDPDTVSTKQGTYDAMCRSNPQSLKDILSIGVNTQHADRDAVNRAADRYCASVTAR